MKALLPLHLDEDGLGLLLRSGGLGNALLAARESGEVAEAIVLYSGAARATRTAHPSATWIEVPATDPSTSGIEGCMKTLAEAMGLGLVEPGERVLFLDCRNPLLRADDLRQALRLSGPAGDPVLAVSPMRDHPCQFRRYFSVVAAAILPLPDPGHAIAALAGRDHVASQPFPLFWPQLFVEEPTPSRFYLVPEHGQGLAALDFGPRPEPGACLLHHEASDTARAVRLPAPDDLDPRAFTLPPFYAPDERPFIGRLDGDELTLHLALDIPGQAGDEIQVLRFDAATPEETTTSLEPRWREAPGGLADPRGRRYSAPLLRVQARGGPLACMLRRENQTEPDGSEILCGEGFPWGVTPDQGLPMRHNGQTITGRQAFPPVFHMAGSLACGRCEDLLRLGETLQAGRAIHLDLGCRDMIVLDEFDLTRAEIFLKPQKDTAL